MKIVVYISGFYIRDAQRFNGREDESDIHSSDDWADVDGDTIIGTFTVSGVDAISDKLKELGVLYPIHTLNVLKII